jgi:hypothetical protein
MTKTWSKKDSTARPICVPRRTRTRRGFGEQCKCICTCSRSRTFTCARHESNYAICVTCSELHAFRALARDRSRVPRLRLCRSPPLDPVACGPKVLLQRLGHLPQHHRLLGRSREQPGHLKYPCLVDPLDGRIPALEEEADEHGHDHRER